jgi:hypothetical protein
MKFVCNRCQPNSLIFDDTDPDFENRKSAHEYGRHTRHETQNERYPDTEPHEINGGLGGLDYGPVIWIPLNEWGKDVA